MSKLESLSRVSSQNQIALIWEETTVIQPLANEERLTPLGFGSFWPQVENAEAPETRSWARAPFSTDFPGQVELLPLPQTHIENPILMCGCVSCGGAGIGEQLNQGPTIGPQSAIVNSYESLLYQGGGWNGATAGKSVFLTYSFELTPASYLSGVYTPAGLASFVAFNAAWQDLTRAALNDWASISGITFLEAPSGQGELAFGSYNLALLNQPNAGGFAYVPFGPDSGATSGDVFIRSEYINADPNSWTWYKHLLLHEIGHAIGLKHPFDGSPNLPTETDNYTNTVMSYTSGGAPGNVLGNLDLAAVQYLYGTNANDATHVSAWNWNATTAVLSQTGFATADRMMGNPGGDSIIAGDGNDTIFGRGGNDTIDAGNGADSITAGTGNDTILAGEGNDTINGGGGNDTIEAGNGDDSISFRLTTPTISGNINGGAGTDRLDIQIANQVNGIATLDMSAANGLSISQIEAITIFGDYGRSNNITGSAFGETLYGNDLADTLNGGGGNDTIYAFDGNDLITGGDGNDNLFAYAGNDTLDGGEGNDFLRFDISAPTSLLTLIGGNGSDTAYFYLLQPSVGSVITFNAAIGTSGSNIASLTGIENIQIQVGSTTIAGDIIGSSFQETISGNILNDTIRGGAGADYVLAGAGNDSIEGGAGLDTLFGEAGSDSLFGGDDIDQLIADSSSAPLANQGNDYVDCGAGNDTAWTYGGDDTLIGGAGNDNLDGGAGADTFFYFDVASGADNIWGFALATDWFNLSGKTFTSAVAQGGGTLLTWANGTILVNNVVDATVSNWNARLFSGGNPTADLLYGSDQADLIFGGGGDDSIYGLAGNDTLNGGDGNDFIDGSLGVDSINGDNDADTIIGTVGDILFGGAGLDVAVAERSGIGANQAITLDQTLTSFLALSGVASASGFESYGVRTGDGADTLVGSNVADYLGGGAGNDFIAAGDGGDTVLGGSGNDMVILGAGNDVGYTDGNVGQDYIYAGLGDDLLIGGSGALDILLGEDGNDTIRGGDGTDLLIGGSGSNQLFGDAGDDIFLSGGLSDTLEGGLGHNYFYRVGAGVSSINGGSGIDEFVGGLNASDDTFTGQNGQDYAFGGNGNDVLMGGAGNDVLIGQNGNDTLEGGSGVNLLWANDAGSDQIRVNIADGGTQVVEFFEAGGSNDAIRLIGSSITSFAGIQALVTNIGVAQGTNIMYNTGSGVQLYLNLGANQTAIWFQGVSAYSLTSGDFLFG
jgi:Ca2+-binding RTX toxin-like protein